MTDEAMKAMAARIADERVTSGIMREWLIAYDAALAAIIETRDTIADYLESVAVKRSDHMKVAAIRSGQQFRKDV